MIEKMLPKNLVKDIYKDLAQPGVKQVGTALETILSTSNTLLIPLKYLNELSNITFNKNMNRLKEKLANVPIEKIGNVSPEIGIPLLEKLFYVTNEELSELFLNLLKRASLKDEAHLAHPNFANVLSSISPDEAKLINFYRGNPIPFISLSINKTEKKENMTWNTVERLNMNFSAIEKKIDLIFPSNFHIYNTNLFCLGIVDAMGYTSVASEAHIELLELHKKEISEQKKAIEEKYIHDETKKVVLEYGEIKFTDFGKMFINACVSK